MFFPAISLSFDGACTQYCGILSWD